MVDFGVSGELLIEEDELAEDSNGVKIPLEIEDIMFSFGILISLKLGFGYGKG